MFDFIKYSILQYFEKGIEWNPLFIVIVVGFFVQILKFVIDSIKHKKIMYSSIISAGGFPSFHTALATSVTTMVWLENGLDSLLLAVCFAFSVLVAYDAMNVRFESGKQARCINEIRSSLSDILLRDKNKNKDLRVPLKERLGHTPVEVAGGMIISFILTFLMYYFLVLK